MGLRAIKSDANAYVFMWAHVCKYSMRHFSGPGCLGLDTMYPPYCTSLPQALQIKRKLPYGITTLLTT